MLADVHGHKWLCLVFYISSWTKCEELLRAWNWDTMIEKTLQMGATPVFLIHYAQHSILSSHDTFETYSKSSVVDWHYSVLIIIWVVLRLSRAWWLSMWVWQDWVWRAAYQLIMSCGGRLWGMVGCILRRACLPAITVLR